MGSFFTKCWEARPNRDTYTRLGLLLNRTNSKVTRAPNENEHLTMTTFAAAGEVIALYDFASVPEPRPLDHRDQEANQLMFDSVIREQLGL